MRTAEHRVENQQVHRLSENLIIQLAKGREWATPGVHAALQKAVAGLDSGIESASPRLQTLLRRLADELAGSVETLTPQVQERIRRMGPKAAAQAAPVPAARSAARMVWWLGGLLLIAAAGAGVWRSLKTSGEEPVPSLTVQGNAGGKPEVEADLAAGQI